MITTTTAADLPAIAAAADTAYEAAVQAHERAEQSIQAADAYLGAVRVRETELQAQAANVSKGARTLRRVVLEALVDRADCPENGASRLGQIEREHGLLAQAIELMVLHRLPDSERALLICRRTEAERRADKFEANLAVRRVAQVAALSLLAAHEGSMDLRTDATLLVQKEILSARDDAARWQRAIDEHDLRIAALRQGATL